MHKRLHSLAPICAALSLLLASGAQANLISAADSAAFASPEEGERPSVLTNFWDNTPQAPRFYFDASSLIVKTREDANLKFRVETATPNPFSFTSGVAAPDYSANFSFNLNSNSPGLDFSPDRLSAPPPFGIRL